HHVGHMPAQPARRWTPRSIGNTHSGLPDSRPFQTCSSENFRRGLWFLEWSADRRQSFPTNLLPDQLGRAVNSHSKSQISYAPAYSAALGRPGRCGELTAAPDDLHAVENSFGLSAGSSVSGALFFEGL